MKYVRLVIAIVLGILTYPIAFVGCTGFGLVTLMAIATFITALLTWNKNKMLEALEFLFMPIYIPYEFWRTYVLENKFDL